MVTPQCKLMSSKSRHLDFASPWGVLEVDCSHPRDAEFLGVLLNMHEYYPAFDTCRLVAVHALSILSKA